MRREEQRQLAHAGELTGDEALEELAVGGERVAAVGVGERAVDVARVALGAR